MSAERAAIGYAANDIDCRQTLYDLDRDQALVMRGRFPRCRFANVVIWRHRLQTPLLPEEEAAPIETEVVDVASLAGRA